MDAASRRTGGGQVDQRAAAAVPECLPRPRPRPLPRSILAAAAAAEDAAADADAESALLARLREV